MNFKEYTQNKILALELREDISPDLKNMQLAILNEEIRLEDIQHGRMEMSEYLAKCFLTSTNQNLTMIAILSDFNRHLNHLHKTVLSPESGDRTIRLQDILNKLKESISEGMPND